MSDDVETDIFDKPARTIGLAGAFAFVAALAVYSNAPAIKDAFEKVKQKCESAVGGVERELMQYAQNTLR
jgi:phage-related minor tail protein